MQRPILATALCVSLLGGIAGFAGLGCTAPTAQAEDSAPAAKSPASPAAPQTQVAQAAEEPADAAKAPAAPSEVPQIVVPLAKPAAVPSDVRANHWARSAVQRLLASGIMSLPDGRAFHGEAKVTHTQAVITLARMAQALETGKWKAAKSAPDSATLLADKRPASWQKQPVTRYMLASSLVRFADYFANGIHRAPADSKDLAQSTALPEKATVSVPRTHPAYTALVYLTSRRMVWPGSPLLKPDNRPATSGEVSRALAQMVAGLTDRLTELGHDSEGNTLDVNSKEERPGR
jgi:hypothetical protein